jgi:glyoxylase-like metal-dependent hydrolase (beta-lactamase superfamily II)
MRISRGAKGAIVMNRVLSIGTFLGLSVVVLALNAQPPGGPPPGAAQDGPKVVEVEKLKDNLYVLRGGGGNSAVFVTQQNGVVVVDTKLPGWGKPLLAKIAELTDKSVTTVINTHVHEDHTGGNVEFPPTTTFVAHANTKTNMQRLDLLKGANAEFLPDRVFDDRLSLFSGADRVDLYYFGRGGTDGDIWAVFPALRTVVGGDAFANRAVTRIDPPNGGTARGYIDALARVVAEIKDVDTVITGHGPAVSWADLVKYVQFNRDFQAWVVAAKRAGKTVEQAAAEYKHPSGYSEYAAPAPAFIQNYIQAIYDEAG